MKKLLWIVLLLFCQLYAAYGNTPSKSYIGSAKLYYGVAYYPEAWGFETLTEDIRQMKELNMNVVRMAEFSWALMEPEEGMYDFKWLHQVVDQLHANGIDVILGTPTATPPIWMAEKYPEIFVLDENGLRKEHGARRNCSYTHPKYWELSEKICLEMAREFGNKPGVIGWQTDNEFNLIHDYSDFTKVLWRKWLKDKYLTIENLNSLWRTNLWSQRYQKFEQIPMPKSNVWHHTSMLVEWDRFSSDQIVAYQDMQIETIRKHSSLPITHDGMPGQKINYPKLFENLDYMSVNAYHSFPVYGRVHSNYDRMRGYGKGMHWLFETAANNSGGGNNGQTWFIHQPDGAMRAAIWMNFVTGGQGAMFWLWRQQPAGQEMTHGAVISAWGEPAANYDDLKKVGEEFNKSSDLLMNAPVEQARIGLFYSHDNDMGLRIEEYSNNISYYKDWAEKFYTPICNVFLHRDVIHEDTELNHYSVLIAPLMPIVSKSLSRRLKSWVEEGGTLIMGPMTGYRTETWSAHTEKALGWLEEWTGIGVKSRIPIDKYNEAFDEAPLIVANSSVFTTSEGACQFWSEALFSSEGKVLGVFKNGMHNGQPAIIENNVGQGKVIFLGSYPGTQMYQEMVLHYTKDKGIAPLAKGDDNLLVVPRLHSDGSRIVCVVNLNNKISKVALTGKRYTDVLSGKLFNSGDLELEPFDVMILKERK